MSPVKNKQKSSPKKRNSAQRPTKDAVHSGIGARLATCLLPLQQWSWRHSRTAESIWGFLVAAPPWAITQYFSVQPFGDDVRAQWPAVASLLGNSALKWMALAFLWITLLNTIRSSASRFLRNEPHGWENASSILVSSFDEIVGHKELRFGEYLVKAQSLKKAGTAPPEDEIFDAITQPKAQLSRLVQGVWHVFHTLLRPYCSVDSVLKTNLVLVRNGKLEGFVCHFPANHKIRSSLEALGNKCSGVMRAAKSKNVLVIESILDESKKRNGNFWVTDSSRAEEDGSLICFPITLSDPDVIFVVSVFHSQPGTFSKRFHRTYSKLLNCFALRIRLEYSLLALKGLGKTEVSQS